MSPEDERLLQYGLDGLTIYDRNNLYIFLAQRDNKLITDITYDYALGHYKDLKIQQLSQQCDDEVSKGFTSQVNQHTYRTTDKDQFNMLAIYTLVKDDATVTTVKFRAEDLDAYVDHPKDDFLNIVKEGFGFVESLNQRFDAAKKTVKDATDGTTVFNTTL
jgi:hypothetical protein